MPDPAPTTLVTDPPKVETPPAGTPPAPAAATAAPTTPPAKVDPPPKADGTEQKTLLTEEPATDPQGQPKGTTPPAEPVAIKPPVGIDAEDPAFKGFVKYAADKKMPTEQAQGIIDMYADALDKQQKAMVSAFEAEKAKWVKDAKSDPEFGGEKLASSLNLAKRAIDKYGTPGLRAVLEQSGLGNHPEVVRIFTRIGRTLSEDSFAGALRPGPATQKTDEQDKLRKKYPSMFPETKKE